MTRSRAAHDASLEPYDTDIEAEARRWESEPDHADLSLISRYLAGELSPGDRARVEERLRTDAEFRALAEPIEMIWKRRRAVSRILSDEADVAEARRTWEKVEKLIDLHEQGIHTPTLLERREKSRRRRLWWRSAIVGGILSFIGYLGVKLRPQLFPAPSWFVHTDAAQDAGRSVMLADSTQVTLLAGSRLWHEPYFARGEERTLNLDGEGTFTVGAGRNQPLIIVGSGVEVWATSGRFTVMAYDAVPTAYVKVYEGQIQVRARKMAWKSRILVLRAGQGARVGPGLAIEHDDPPIVPNAQPDSAARAPNRKPKAAARNVVRDSLITPTPPADVNARIPELFDTIERDFGERPRNIGVRAADTLEIQFWNPAFLHNDSTSRDFPRAGLPDVAKAATHVAQFVWRTLAREGGFNIIRIAFMRVRTEDGLSGPRQVRAQEVSAVFTRKMLETGKPAAPVLSIVQQ